MSSLRKKDVILGRSFADKRAMMSRMACSLISHKSIKTTLLKAKALRNFIEPIISKARNNTSHSRRVVFGYLQDAEAVSTLFQIATKIGTSRPGGYTRVTRINERSRENADMAIVTIIDFNKISAKARDDERWMALLRLGKNNVSEVDSNDERNNPVIETVVEDAQKQDLSAIKDSPHFNEGSNEKIVAFRNFKLLTRYQQTGEIKSSLNKHDRKVIQDFIELTEQEKKEKMAMLKGLYTKVS